MKNTKKIWTLSGVMMGLFLLTMAGVKFIDVAPIGPENSKIGFSTINAAVRDFFGINMFWYNVTEILGIVAIATAACFGLIGFVQLVKHRSIQKVDSDIILLGVLYGAVIVFYGLFEVVVINYRPVLMEGILEASFPSSHTMLVVSIMGSRIYQAIIRIKFTALCNVAVIFCTVVMIVTVSGRLACGVHWFTDIIAGVFLSFSLILAYVALRRTASTNRHLRYTGK